MARIKNISTALSVASSLLLVACASESTDSGPAPEINIKALELIGSWQTDCVVISQGTTTPTGASGGGSVSGGEAYRSSANFNQNGRVEFFSQVFATSNCNANTVASSSTYNTNYYIGDATLAIDSSPATKINYSVSGSASYSLFQIVNSSSLYLGDGATSSPGNNGLSESARFDGLGAEMLKQ